MNERHGVTDTAVPIPCANGAPAHCAPFHPLEDIFSELHASTAGSSSPREAADVYVELCMLRL